MTKKKEGWETALALVKQVKPSAALIIGNNEERIINEHFGGSFARFRDYCSSLGFNNLRYMSEKANY